MDEKYCRNLEKLFVHYVYDEISPYYDDNEFCANLEIKNSTTTTTKQQNITINNRAWRKVKQFLLDLEPNSLVADIGCGNGKYLQLNQSVYSIGCDICSSLVNTASNQSLTNSQLIVCDNLNLPFRLVNKLKFQ
jgi:ubiquinone/menaquinone biosynthesis C-methylase UbiE